jgi:hypothetical protein
MFRLRLVAVVAIAGVLLTGCARDTDEALRVGDVSVDNAQVDAIAAPLVARLQGNGVSDEIRANVAEQTVFLEVARRYAREKGITPEAPDYQAAATRIQASVDDPYVRLNAESEAYLNALRENTPARTPTEAELREGYDRFIRLVGSSPATYEQIREELLTLALYANSLALRDELTAAMGRYGVTVNPRYQPLEFPLFAVTVTASGGQLVLVSLPLGEQGTGAVRSVG